MGGIKFRNYNKKIVIILQPWHAFWGWGDDYWVCLWCPSELLLRSRMSCSDDSSHALCFWTLNPRTLSMIVSAYFIFLCKGRGTFDGICFHRSNDWSGSWLVYEPAFCFAFVESLGWFGPLFLPIVGGSFRLFQLSFSFLEFDVVEGSFGKIIFFIFSPTYLLHVKLVLLWTLIFYVRLHV